MSNDDVETSDSGEAIGRHSTSSESGDNGDGLGSESRVDDVEAGSGAKSRDDASSGSGSETDSDNGTDGDSAPESSSPRKRTNRAS